MFFTLIVFYSDGIGANHNVVVIGKLGELGVKSGNFNIQASTVFDRECFKVQFAEEVNIFSSLT